VTVAGASDRTVLGPARLSVHGGWLEVPGHATEPARLRVGFEPVLLGRDASCDLVIPSSRVSAVHAELAATARGVRLRDVGSRNGTWVGDVRIAEAYLTERASVWLGDVELVFEPSKPERVKVQSGDRLGRMYGASPAMRAVFEQIARVAPTDLTVLVQGETGTGKELVAQAIHEHSRRRQAPFVVVDCGSIPPTLAEATLFGHERGAFTGATERRRSPFLEAGAGTVFLDELGELPLDLQPKLLRVLAERRLKPVGGQSYLPVEARVVAATRRDLVREVNDGTFRSDLYFRVAQMRIEVPALRARLSDLSGLVKTVLEDLGDPAAFKRVGRETMERLLRHDWPGNVRELANAVTVAHAIADVGGPIDVAGHLNTLGVATVTGPLLREHPSAPQTYHDAKRVALDRFEREFFEPLVEATGGNVAEIARIAGLERAHVRRYVTRHGLRKKRRAK
jgi:DNA-binding NtrC family response regulator